MGISGLGSSSVDFAKLLEVAWGDEEGYAVNGEPATEEDVNKILSQQGHDLQVKQGTYVTSDGYEIGSGGGGDAAATNFGGATPLPDVKGRGSAPGTVGEKSEWLSDISDGALAWYGMMMMAKSGMRDSTEAGELRRAVTDLKSDTKEMILDATSAQIQHERDAATEQMITAIVAASVTAALAIAGSAAGGLGTFFGAIATPVGMVAQKAGEAHIVNHGAQRKADDAKEQIKRLEKHEAVLEDSGESAKQNQEAAKEQFKLALRIILESVELKTQVIQKSTS